MSDLSPERIEEALAVLFDTCRYGEAHKAVNTLQAALREAQAENARWLAWSNGDYPDDSPGDVIAAEADGTIVLDDGITTWNPLRALAFLVVSPPADEAKR